MEEENVKIKKIITTIDKDNKSYSIDLDETNTFYEFKKIISGAAHLLKNCFRIFHENHEYTNDYDDNTIQELFPTLNPIPLHIVTTKEVNELEDELVSIRFNINVPCQAHVGKYKMLYCFTCNKSICSDCLMEGHKDHQFEEKADYLAPAQFLMNIIFKDSSMYRADARLSKYMDSVTFRSNLKANIFDKLRQLITDLEMKFTSCFEFFSKCEDETEKNTNENLELLRKYCIECFIKLKNDINTKGIIIDDEIFLTIYHKLKEIEKFKNEIFEENKKKYEKINTLLEPFIQQVEVISQDVKNLVDNYLNNDIYEKFKGLVQENIVEKIPKEQVNDVMFRNLGVPRKSLNRLSFNNLSLYRKNGATNILSYNTVVQQKTEDNPFKKVAFTEKQEKQGYNIDISNKKNIQQNNYNTNSWSKIEQQNKGITAFNQGKIGETGSKKRSTLTTNNQINNQYTGNHVISSTQQILSSNDNLIDVLNNEIQKAQNEQVSKTQVNNFTTNSFQLNSINKILFFAAVFNTNEVIGALPDESSANIPLDFKQAFGDKDIQYNQFPEGGAFCNYGKYFYFCGGEEKDKGKIFLRVTYNQNENKLRVAKMPSMIYSHYNHSIICNGNYIFSVGGYKSKKCEYFNLKSLKWEPMADLNSEERQRPMLVVYKDYLYAFMGYTQNGILDSVERIKISKIEGNKWEKVSISNPQHLNIKFYGAGIYKHQKSIIFVAGKIGLGNSDSDFRKEIFRFNFDNMEIAALDCYYPGNICFIESEFKHMENDNIGNFTNLNNGCLATLGISFLTNN